MAKKSTATAIVASNIRKYATISDLERTSKGSVFVINNLKQEVRGNIVIPVARKNGNGQDVVRVPPTFIPIDLTMQVSKSQLMESTEFRKTIANRLLLLVTPEYAETILDTPEGQEESRQVAASMSRARTMVEAEMLSGASKTNSLVNDVSDDTDFGETSLGKLEDAGIEKQLNPRSLTDKQKKVIEGKKQNAEDRALSEVAQPRLQFKKMIKELLDEEKSETQVIIALKNRRPLSKLELAFAAKHFNTKLRVMKFLREEKERAN